MIEYNPKEWIAYIFNFHKADTVRKLGPLLLLVGAYCAGLYWVEIHYWKVSPDSELKNLNVMHSLLGFALSMLLVFRTNTAYDRWWEGRRQWGTLVNASRGLSLKLASFLEDKDPASMKYFSVMIPNYAYALKAHLRGEFAPAEWQEVPGFEGSSVKADQHVPNQLAMLIFRKLNTLFENRVINSEQLSMITNDLSAFSDVSGACERIRNTPIPFSYSSFLKKFIFFYVLTLPFSFVLTLGVFVVPVCIFIFYVLASLELIAEEIEDPFGTDANDLDLDGICGGIRKAVQHIFEQS